MAALNNQRVYPEDFSFVISKSYPVPRSPRCSWLLARIALGGPMVDRREVSAVFVGEFHGI